MRTGIDRNWPYRRGVRISTRTLNRTYLRRQLLLDDVPNTVPDAVGRLVAVQAQEVDAPYVGLWARLPGFTHGELTAALEDRSVVRGGLLRGTQHLTTAEDYRWLRPLIRAGMGNAGLSAFRRQIEGLELAEIAAAATEALAGRTMTRPQLARALGERFPGREAIALAWAAQHQLSLVHPPPSGTWGRRGHVHVTLAEEWIGAPLRESTAEELLWRYLASCGPATAADLQIWSGVRRLRDAVEALRPRLRVYRDEAGRELFDAPDLDLADPDEPAPVRFLPEFDNLVLSHDDRGRIIASAADRALVCPGYSIVRPTFLVDGFVAGTWSAEPGRLVVAPFRPLADPAPVHAEALRLLEFLRLTDAEVVLEER
ncbi:winged helix DNA-binding domain-containing protein [Dactylosporangium darangshiense]|uniref:Winged helix DNA-binding domain-containing protein n=1 Tax=Dactylosporangium darangshiense TaxID=579108 RepID=A0ABP8DTZ0_9ACTN